MKIFKFYYRAQDDKIRVRVFTSPDLDKTCADENGSLVFDKEAWQEFMSRSINPHTIFIDEDAQGFTY